MIFTVYKKVLKPCSLKDQTEIVAPS